MSTNYGSKRIVVGAHYGVRDWLVQRATAVLMALFTVIIIVQCLLPGEMSYDTIMNVLYQDGHVGSMKATDFNNTNYNPNTTGQSEFWQPLAQ